MIEVKNLRKTYRKHGTEVGLLGADFTVPDGQIVGILGENGAGKTTLLRSMAGLLPAKGEALFDGKPAAVQYERISYITGEGSYYPTLTAAEYGAMLADLNPAFDEVRYKEFLDFFSLSGKDVIGHLSTGQKARVELAAGFAKRAAYYLMDEPFLGKDPFTRKDFIKLMSGTLHEGDDLLNADRGSRERMAQIFVCAGANREKVEQLEAGDIGCTVKLKDVRTGNTLNGKDCENRFNFIKYPNPKYTRAIKAVNEADTEKMMAALNRMRQEDPTWEVEQSKELRQILVHGQGEFHLRTLKWRLENLDKIAVEFYEQRIPYRETITKAARADYRHKKQSGGAGQFGEVHLIVEPYSDGMPDPTVYKLGNQEIRIAMKGKEEIPLEWGGKLVFINSVVGGAIDTRFMPAILKGIMSRMEQGPLTGSYARDVRVIVYDGKMHPVDSNEVSFMLAGRNAFSQAFKEAGPKILEPIYDVEVFVPAEKMGDVMSDLQGRRGMIVGMSSENGYEKLQAKVPLKEMSSYSTTLSSLTGGRASFIMKFASYELVPGDIQNKLIEAFEKEQEEDK